MNSTISINPGDFVTITMSSLLKTYESATGDKF